MAKRRNIISSIIAFLLWVFYRRTSEDQNSIYQPRSEYLKLDSQSFGKLSKGNWIVVLGDMPETDEYLLEHVAEQNIAFLSINDWETANIAAKLQIRKTNEVLLLTDNCIFSTSGIRNLKETVGWNEILDYLIFSWIFRIRRRIKTVHTSEGLIEFLEECITRATITFLNICL